MDLYKGNYVSAGVSTAAMFIPFVSAPVMKKLLGVGADLYSRFPNALKKFEKHAADFTSISDVDVYYKRAVSLADSGIGGNILGFTSKDGWIFRMNSNTGEFLTINPSGEITTFYRRLSDPLEYWAEQVNKYGK